MLGKLFNLFIPWLWEEEQRMGGRKGHGDKVDNSVLTILFQDDGVRHN